MPVRAVQTSKAGVGPRPHWYSGILWRPKWMAVAPGRVIRPQGRGIGQPPYSFGAMRHGMYLPPIGSFGDVHALVELVRRYEAVATPWATLDRTPLRRTRVEAITAPSCVPSQPPGSPRPPRRTS
jgi:hypothetical protein